MIIDHIHEWWYTALICLPIWQWIWSYIPPPFAFNECVWSVIWRHWMKCYHTLLLAICWINWIQPSNMNIGAVFIWLWLLMFIPFEYWCLKRVLCRLFSLDILCRLASQDKWFSTVLLGHKTLNFHQYIFRKAGCKWHIILHISDKSWNISIFKWGINVDLTTLVASYIRRQLPGGKGINLGHQEEEAHPVGGNRRICTAKNSKN